MIGLGTKGTMFNGWAKMLLKVAVITRPKDAAQVGKVTNGCCWRKERWEWTGSEGKRGGLGQYLIAEIFT